MLLGQLFFNSQIKPAIILLVSELCPLVPGLGRLPIHQMTILLLSRPLFKVDSLRLCQKQAYFISHKLQQIPAPGPDSIWKPVPAKPLSFPLLLKSLGALSKFKLSALVVLTTMSGHVMAASQLPAIAISTTPSQLALTLLGTTLCSFSANTLNQWAEAPLDAQMARTQSRPLPRLVLTPFAAFNWAIVSGATGIGLLAFGVNPLAAGLAGLTIVLYGGVYTPLKRVSIVNTWIGALVGAIPPLIGWTAAWPELTPAAFILPAVLFCWQFPHFNALSWNYRAEYARAGYKMAAVLNPKLNGRVALRYSLALIPVTLASSALSLTTPLFALTGNLVNAPLIFQAIKFWRNPTRKSARGLFFASLIHLPLFMVLLFVHRECEKDKTKNSSNNKDVN